MILIIAYGLTKENDHIIQRVFAERYYREP